MVLLGLVLGYTLVICVPLEASILWDIKSANSLVENWASNGMRVVEPHQFKALKPLKAPRSKKAMAVVILLLLGVAGLIKGSSWLAATFTKPKTPASIPSSESEPLTTAAAPAKTGAFKQFSGEDFKVLYQSIAYPNTQSIVDPPPITGNDEADNRIRQFAEARGYHLTSVPMSAIVKINEPRLDNDDLLQPLAAEAWQSLKQTAERQQVPLSLISAYRSPEYQRELFLGRLLSNGVTVHQIALGGANYAIEDTLDLTAVPGYSRHHTGYTIDLWCEDGSTTFLNSRCYQWISASNYLKAKEHGWIPSYPEGTDLQGPEPEPWEYVWVGTDNLREAN